MAYAEIAAALQRSSTASARGLQRLANGDSAISVRGAHGRQQNSDE